MTESTELLIRLAVEDGDDVELDELTRDLKIEIDNLHVDSVENVSGGDAPAGTKAAGWANIGQIAVQLAPTAVPLLFEVLRFWLERKPSRLVKINIRVGKGYTHQIEYDPAKTSAKELESLVKILKKSLRN